jgi:hypothetical protein
MPLTTLPVVKALLGITDSTHDIQLQALIDGVCEQICRYCARNFEKVDVALKLILDQNNEIVLDETPVNHVYYFALGNSEVLLLTNTAANAQASFRVDPGPAFGKLTLVSGMVAVDIAVPITMTMAQLEVLINMEAGWAASVATGYDDYPANALLDQSAETEEAGTPFALRAALSTRRLIRGDVEGVFEISGCSFDEYFDHYGSRDVRAPSAPMVCLYNGGYTVIPAGLLLVVNKVCCDAWLNFSSNAAMKSETIGDYSYEKWAGAGGAAYIASAIGPFMGALDLYKRV